MNRKKTKETGRPDQARNERTIGSHGRAAKLVACALIAAVGFSGCTHGVKNDPWADASRNLSKLEKDLRGNGLVTVKRPDVWTENRLYPYRREFEDVFKSIDDLKAFKPKLTASESAVQTQRLGMYLNAAMEVERIRADKGPGLSQYLALAILQNAVPGVPMNQAAFTKLLQAGTGQYIAQQSGLDPTMFAGLLDHADKDNNDTGKDNEDGSESPAGGESTDAAGGTSGEGEGAASPDAGAASTDAGAAGSPPPPHAFPWMLTDDIEDFHKVPQAAGTLDLLSPFEEQKQKRAFVQQNHMFRIGNEPDDGTRMNGYRLYYMRFMVSVTPSAKTQTGHSAEVMLTPTYPVAEAARDWVAQYVRGMLRERILRMVEVGLERVIAGRLYEYGASTPSWDVQEYLIERVHAIEERVAEARKFVEADECDKAKVAFEAARSRIDGLLDRAPEATFKAMDPTFKAMLEEILVDLTSLERSCTVATAATKAQEFLSMTQLSPFRESEIGVEFANLLDPSEKKEFARIESSSAFVAFISETADAKAAKAVDIFDRVLARFQTLGSQQDVDAVRYAHDVGTKLRNEYLGIMRLAQLAYDELSREADWLLRVPNAVGDKEDALRRSRAQSALCDIVSMRTGEGQVAPSTLSGAVDLSPQEIVNIRPLVHDAIAELTLRIGRYKSPTNDLKRLYLSESKKKVDFTLNAAINKLEKIIDVRPSAPGSNMKAPDTASIIDSCILNARPPGMLSLDFQRFCLLRGFIGYIGINSAQESISVADETKFLERLRGYFSTDNWPIYTFAVAPFSEAENIGRAIDLNNEVQFRLNAALKLSKLGEVEGALEHARAVREQLRAVEVNRTVVGLVRGEQNFGWQFNPPYGLPVQVKQGGKYVRTGYHDLEMPSQTHEVFALVAVPGFLRSLDFGVHYDWTGVQRTDAEVIGTNKAATYLRSFRGVYNKLGDLADTSDLDDLSEEEKLEKLENRFFFGELYQQRLELIESSLPLRMMRRVFLPYGDVSERMTNTAGVSNLLPRITRVVPRYLPSEQAVVVTIEGRNFDTGRIDVMIGGHAATKVEVLNEKTIAATVPARGIIADLTVVKRDGRLFNEAKETQSGKKLLHDLEGVVEVIVVTPAGLATDVALLRITKPVDAARESDAISGTIPEKKVIVPSSLWDQTDLKIPLTEGLKETSGTLVFKHESQSIDLPVTIRDREVTLRDPIGGAAQSTLTKLIDKEIANATLYPHGGHPSGITIKGKLKVESLTVKIPAKLTVEAAGAPPKNMVKESAVELTFAQPVRLKSGKLVITSNANPPHVQPIDLADLTGTRINVLLNDDQRKAIGAWLDANPNGLDLILKLDGARREANGIAETLELGRMRLEK